jgi:NAD(P)-dependent dehydrogenase (short-subunit alcohol dehydrogenase family)/acyl dehydratase
MRWTLTLDPGLVELFAAATGDRSAIHMEVEFARLTRFRRPIVHGMLPVLAVLRGASSRWQRDALWLRQFSCRFLNPAHAGERLQLTLSVETSADASTHFRFSIADAEGNVLITQGEAAFAAGSAGGRPSESVSCLVRPVEERFLEASGVALGLSEAVAFRAAPAGIRELLAALDNHAAVPGGDCPWATFDPNLASLLPASTLIGMRLPGRLATFTEFDAVFDRPIGADSEIELHGSVEKIQPGRNRLRLSLEWKLQDVTVATGSAAAILNPSAPIGIGCDEIRSRHIGTGIEGRVALVTGASRGIGQAIAKLLAMHGAKVAVHYFRGSRDATATVNDIVQHGGIAIPVRGDLRQEPDIEDMFARVREAFGNVDILVNNAVGEFTPKPFKDLVSRDYLDEIEVSLLGLHACCKRAVESMRARRYGKIVNISTIATETPASGQSKYITAKSAVIGYTRSLAAELARENVQVNLVLPRMTDTSLVASLPRAIVDRIASESPNGELLQPIDVAKAVLFLVSDWATPISGQRILLNQGEAPFI